jgi:hypothetical protein
MSELDRYVFYWNKGTAYFLHSWAGMRSPGPFKTLHVAATIGM